MPRATTPLSEVGVTDASLDVQTSGFAPDSSSVGGDSGVPSRSIGDTKVPYDILRYIPEESAQHYRLAPLSVVDGVLEVGMVDPDDIRGFDALNFIARSTGLPFKVYRISVEDFERIIDMYHGLGGDVERAVTDLATEQKERREEPLPHPWISMTRL